jgi:hypothetical protein
MFQDSERLFAASVLSSVAHNFAYALYNNSYLNPIVTVPLNIPLASVSSIRDNPKHYKTVNLNKEETITENI